VAGFSDYPDVGVPMYVVNNPDEARFIIKQRQTRKEQADAKKKSIVNIDKKIDKMTKREKRKLYSGDKSLLF
jgi:hypothetical protein